jgi:GNAT superfamily N-acetyltransferase
LKTAIENSICFGVYRHDKQAGFARVITDKATFAYICDVFILPAYRRSGLSKWLMQTIIRHPELQGLRRWSLATADAHGLYAQFGFTGLSKPENWMEITTPYKKQHQGE